MYQTIVANSSTYVATCLLHVHRQAHPIQRFGIDDNTYMHIMQMGAVGDIFAHLSTSYKQEWKRIQKNMEVS